MQIVQPDAWSVIPRYNWTKKDLFEFHEQYNAACTFQAKWMEGVQDAIAKLKADGHELFLITARSNDQICFEGKSIPEQDRVEEMLKAMDITFDRYFWGVGDKVSACKEHQVDMMIDDRPNHCEALSQAGIFTLKFLCKLNWMMPENAYLKNVSSWQEILKQIENFTLKMGN